MDKDLSENLTATDQSANNDQTSSNNEQSQINQISAELSLAGTDLKKLEMLKHLETRRITPDKNLRGWIGTELTHKAFEVYECAKNEERIFSLSQKLTRKYDILDSLKYIVDENGIPQLACIEQVIESEQRQKQIGNGGRPELNKKYLLGWEGNKPVLKVAALFTDAMPLEGALYVATDMQEMVMRLANITSPYYYNKIREQALSENIIVKSTTTDGYVAYYRPE